MGPKLTCPCGRNESEISIVENKKKVDDIINQMMLMKLTPQSIIYDFSYDITKLYLIKSVHIEEFCNNRNLFKYTKKSKDIFIYFNIFFAANYLNKKDTAMVLLQYHPPQPYQENIYYHPKMSRFDLISGIFKVEDFSYTFEEFLDNANFVEKLIKLIK